MTIGLILLFSLQFITTQAITSEALKKELIEQLCGTVGCQLTFERLELFLLPTPHADASEVQFTLPGTLSGTIASISIFPKMLPLLSGRVELAEIRLTAPRMGITIPENSPTVPSAEAFSPGSATGARQPAWPGRQSDLSVHDATSALQLSAPAPQDSSPIAQEHSPWLSWPYLEGRLLSLVRILSEKAPGLRLQIDRGSFEIIHGTPPSISLRDLSALVSLPPDMLALEIQCRSDFWEKMVVNGRIDPVASQGTAHLRVHHGQSRLLGKYLSAGVLKPVGDSPVDLDLSLSSQGSGLFQATFQASSPSLTLELGTHQAVIKGIALEGALQAGADRIEIRLARLHAEDPHLELAGRFWSDPASSETAYQLACRDADATAIREVALALAGESEVVQDVFTFIKGGHVPLATFEAHGLSVTELQEFPRLVVKGRLENGEVSVPKIGLNINEVYGDVLISHGILYGTNLEGKVERSIGRQGSLTVALAEKDGPFHLDIMVDADLAQLPPVLARVVDNQPFLKELALVRDVSGRASGRLLLGDTLNGIRTRVEVADWQLQGFYERLPFPIALEAKGLVYEGSELAVKALQGRMGQSEVHDFSGVLMWSREPALELASPANGHILLEELFPWLLTFSSVRDNRWKIDALDGALRLDSVTFKGTLAKPESWRFALTGQLRNVTSTSRLLGPPLKIGTGMLSCTHQSLEPQKWEVAFLDALLTVSGSLGGFLAERPSADFSLQGTLGPQATSWLSDVAEIPSELRVRAPLSLLPSRFVLDHSGRTTLSGVFRTGAGAELSLALDRDVQELVLKQLKVHDQETNAIITLSLKLEETGFGFQGNLSGGTLDRLLAANHFFKGTMTGNFSAQLYRNRLADSRAVGQLAFTDFCYAPVPGKTLKVEEALIEAREHVLELKKASIRLQDEPLKLSGTVSAGQNQLLLDLDLGTWSIDWNQLQAGDILKKLGDSSFGAAPAEGMTFLGIPVRGGLRIQADHFLFGSFTWKPFRAELAFASDGLNVEVNRADLCTIPTPIRIVPHPQGSVLVINPAARNLDLDAALACLFDRKGFITGTFDLGGEITATVQSERMTDTLRGKLNLEARNGRVYRSPVLSRIFTLLNVTEIYRGRLPDFVHEGCAYDSITVPAALKNGKVLIEDAVFDGHCAKMVWTGEIDPATLKVNFIVLVSPFKTVDTVIRQIPLLGSIMGGTLITIPVQVAGDITDPDVIPLAPTAVGAGLLNTMKKVLRLPFTLRQPLR